MITDKQGEAAVGEIVAWASRIIRPLDDKIQASAYHDADSRTYVIRLSKGIRVLLFRLSETQLRTPGREAECEQIVRRRVKEMSR